MMHVFGWRLADVEAMEPDDTSYWADQAERLYIHLHTPAEGG